MIDLRTLAQGDASRIVEPRRIVVRGDEEWKQVWRLHSGSAAGLPPVNFANRIVVAAFAGERPTAGHRIDIQAESDDGQGIRLRVHERTPARDSLVAQILTFPFHMVSLPRTAGGVSWAGARSGDEPTMMLASDTVKQAVDTGSSTGLRSQTAAALAYVAGPLSGGLMLLAESRNGDVRFHAWQSILAIGGLLALVAIGYALAVLSLFTFVGAVSFFVRLSSVIWIASLAVCVVCIWKASRGGRWKLPLAGRWAERLAGAAHG